MLHSQILRKIGTISRIVTCTSDICFYGFSDEERQEMLNYLERMSTNIEKYREK